MYELPIELCVSFCEYLYCCQSTRQVREEQVIFNQQKKSTFSVLFVYVIMANTEKKC